MKMKMNDQLYEGIKKRLTEDLIIAYEVFKEEEHQNLEGVILSLNPLNNFGKYLRENPDKLADFSGHLYENIDFIVHLAFNKEFDDEFFPLIEK
jgi:hypothetical protein